MLRNFDIFNVLIWAIVNYNIITLKLILNAFSQTSSLQADNINR